MPNITELIKDLRNKTGAGFLDCKNALSENNNDIESSVEYLRKKGLAKASKKTSREANEGGVGIYSDKDLIVILKVNSETDFAAKSDSFLNFVDELGKIALNHGNKEMDKNKFLDLNFNDKTVSEHINNMIAKIGENIVLNDIVCLDKTVNHFSYYIHNSYKDNIGKLISYISYSAKNNTNEIQNFSRNICMHIAAMKPESLDIDDLDENIINNEKNIQKELILSSGKPANIVDKILEGKMKKFYSEVTLLNQNYVLDQDKTVKDMIKSYEMSENFKILNFNLISL